MSLVRKLLQVCNQLNLGSWEEDGSLPNFSFIEINGMISGTTIDYTTGGYLWSGRVPEPTRALCFSVNQKLTPLVG